MDQPIPDSEFRSSRVLELAELQKQIDKLTHKRDALLRRLDGFKRFDCLACGRPCICSDGRVRFCDLECRKRAATCKRLYGENWRVAALKMYLTKEAKEVRRLAEESREGFIAYF